MTHQLDALRAERRQLSWVRVDKPCVFDGPEGECTLGDLFGNRRQLAIYHFMLKPGSDHSCPDFSFTVDYVDAARQYFEQADLSFAAVSRAPIQQIKEVKQRMGWNIPLSFVGRSRLQLRFRCTVHAGGPRSRPCNLQLRAHPDPYQFGFVRRQRLREGREG
jgi:predicted dithiol-disulfide oxidoreductase (DUF899 family)